MIDVRIDNIDESNDNFFKSAEIRAGSGNYFKLMPLVNSRLTLHDRLIPNDKKVTIAECYMEITKEKLNEIDSDRDKQRKFVMSKFGNIDYDHILIIPKILLLEGETINRNEMRYLINLMSFPGNMIYVSPLFYHYKYSEKGRISKGNQVDVDAFFSMTKIFLDELTNDSVNQVGLSLQFNVLGSKIPTLLDIYKDFSTPFALLDGAGKSNVDNYLQIKYLTSKAENSYGLPQKQNENYVLYSFDSKQTRGRKEVTPALNILQLNEGFSSFGPRHTIKFKRREADPPEKPKPQYVPKIFYRDHISYSKHNVENPKNAFLEWLERQGVGIDKEYEKQVRTYVADYEYFNIFEVTEKLNEGVSQGGVDSVISGVEEVKSEVKKIRKNNRLIKSK